MARAIPQTKEEEEVFNFARGDNEQYSYDHIKSAINKSHHLAIFLFVASLIIRKVKAFSIQGEPKM